MAANPPKFLDHHVPTPGWALVPDCLCAECSAVRKAWGQERADEQLFVSVDPGHEDMSAVVVAKREDGVIRVVSVDVGKARSACPEGVFTVGCVCATCRATRVRAGKADGLPEQTWGEVAWQGEVKRPPLGPPLVWRDVTCPGCRRFFCSVLTLADVKLIPHCEGCALEGR